MTHYIALFLPVVEGGYSIFFPDFAEIASEGDNLDECMEMAADALSIAVIEYAKARRELPHPCSLEVAHAAAQAEMGSEGIDTQRDPVLQLIAAPSVDLTPVRISISVAKSALDDIDRKAQALGMTRSGFLVQSATAYEVRT